jgi:hypothetical protein
MDNYNQLLLLIQASDFSQFVYLYQTFADKDQKIAKIGISESNEKS